MHVGVEEGDWLPGTYGLWQTERQDGRMASVSSGRIRAVNLFLYAA